MNVRIMTVDDSASVRMMVRYTLQGAGYDVVEAVDGLDALEKLSSTYLQALIVDVNMPRLDGIEFVRRLRKVPGYRNTPVLMLTTEEGRNRIEEGRSAGADGWIVKPFSPEELIAVLGKVMS